MNPATERESGNGNAKVKSSRLPFSAVPHQSRLFLEYLRDPVSLKKYYPNALVNVDDAVGFVPQVLANYQVDRNAVCDILADINAEIGASDATLANIERLRESNTVAVLTGQQAGLFTGPLYTVYKALSAIKMAERLTAAGTSAVPIFWAATEDHDFDEVSKSFFIGASGELVSSEYRPAGYVADSQVGDVVIDDAISAEVEDLFDALPKTEFSDQMRAMLDGSWVTGSGIGTAFLETLAALLGKYGLIFVDPTSAKLKRLAAPLLAAAVSKSDEIVDTISIRSRELVDEGFHAQVLVEADYFPLFWLDDEGHRLALKRSGDGTYRTKNRSREFSLGELQKLAFVEPERFSPGVMLRPVVQDFLFPTVCYFGGGAEIAYFAQNSEVYRVLDRPITPILHRQSFTIVESGQQRAFEKLGIALTDLFDEPNALVTRLIEKTLTPETALLFTDVEERISRELDRLDRDVSQIDVTIAANLAKRRRKIIYHIGAVRKKTLLAFSRKDETFKRRIDALFTALMPNRGLQERSINVFSYLNKFGPNFIDWIYDSIDLDDRDHRIIEL